MQPYASLGARLRQARAERGLSQADLAKDIVSPSYVSLIEAGRRAPERSVIEALAQRLGVHAGFLESGVDPQEANEAELRLRFAELALANGDTDEARRRFTELAAGTTRLRALWGLARTEEAATDLDRALEHIEAVVEASRRGESGGPGLVVALTQRCRLYREAGDLGRSVELGEHAMEEIRELGLDGTEDEVRLGSTLVASYWERGDLTTATRLADEVIANAERHGSQRARGSAYWNAALVTEARGHLALAIELAGRALAMFAEGVDERSIARLRTDLAWLLLRMQPPDLDRAEPLLQRSYETLRAANIGTDLAYCETELARCRLHRGRPDEAAELALRALARLRGHASAELGRTRLVLGQALLMSGLTDDGISECRRAADHLRQVGASRQAVGVWREIAETLEGLGLMNEALEAYRALADCAGAVRVPRPPAPVLAVEPTAAGITGSSRPARQR